MHNSTLPQNTILQKIRYTATVFFSWYDVLNITSSCITIGVTVMKEMFLKNGVGNCCEEPCHFNTNRIGNTLVALPTAFAWTLRAIINSISSCLYI